MWISAYLFKNLCVALSCRSQNILQAKKSSSETKLGIESVYFRTRSDCIVLYRGVPDGYVGSRRMNRSHIGSARVVFVALCVELGLLRRNDRPLDPARWRRIVHRQEYQDAPWEKKWVDGKRWNCSITKRHLGLLKLWGPGMSTTQGPRVWGTGEGLGSGHFVLLHQVFVLCTVDQSLPDLHSLEKGRPQTEREFSCLVNFAVHFGLDLENSIRVRRSAWLVVAGSRLLTRHLTDSLSCTMTASSESRLPSMLRSLMLAGNVQRTARFSWRRNVWQDGGTTHALTNKTTP